MNYISIKGLERKKLRGNKREQLHPVHPTGVVLDDVGQKEARQGHEVPQMEEEVSMCSQR